MKVMQVMAGGRHGGAEAFFTRLVTALADAGVDQQVAVRGAQERLAALREAGLSPLDLRFGGPLDLATRWRLAAACRRYNPDIVLSWMNRATAISPRGPWLRVARLGGYYNLKYYRHCDHLIGNTRDIVDYLVREGWPADRAHYLPNFVEARPLPAVPRAEFGTPADAPLILALGRLHPNKAFDTLLKAMAKVGNAWLWLAGDGPDRRMLEALAAEAGVADRVRFLGWREDVSALFAAADIFVCPSRHEPLGNVVIEGWAHGRAVVAARAAGPESLIEDGATGLLAPVDDVEAMAAALNRAVADRDLRDRLAAAGEAAYRARFTREVVVRQYRDFFERIVAPPASR